MNLGQAARYTDSVKRLLRTRRDERTNNRATFQPSPTSSDARARIQAEGEV